VRPRAGRGFAARPLYSQHDPEKACPGRGPGRDPGWYRFSEMIRLKE